jgi:hypothetical protein
MPQPKYREIVGRIDILIGRLDASMVRIQELADRLNDRWPEEETEPE